MGKTFKERLELLDDIKETLISDRKFHLNRKDWDQVKITNECLRKHSEQVARVIYMMSKSDKDTYKSA
jgi:hypothetical protein